LLCGALEKLGERRSENTCSPYLNVTFYAFLYSYRASVWHGGGAEFEISQLATLFHTCLRPEKHREPNPSDRTERVIYDFNWKLFLY
jgi:hypothetical protein